MTNPTNPPACRVMYQSYSGLIFESRQPADTPVLVIPLDPANVERVVEVMAAELSGRTVKGFRKTDTGCQEAFWYDAQSVLTALINHAKETSK